MTDDQRILYVGIAGKKRHGKDTFAGYLKEHLLTIHSAQLAVVRRGFADSLREEVGLFLNRELDGHPLWPSEPHHRLQQIMQHLSSAVPEEKEPFRLLMQWWGVEFRRSMFGDAYWLDALERFAQFFSLSTPKTVTPVVLIPDVRMPNEVSFVRSRGGFLVKVFRPNQEDTDSHSTETALDACGDWNTFILNNGTLDQLQQAAVIFGDRVWEASQ